MLNDGILSDELIEIIDGLPDDIKTDDKLLFEFACNQVVNGIDCRSHGNHRQFIGLIKGWYYSDGAMKIQDVVGSMDGKDFDWQLYDNTLAVIERYHLSVGFGEPKPTLPDDIQEVLGWLTVNEMKELLRHNGQKVSGNRSELEERILTYISLDDIQPTIQAKFDDKLAKHNQAILESKYSLLLDFIKRRYLFLQDIIKRHNADGEIGIAKFAPQSIMYFSANPADFNKLLYEIYGFSYDDVVFGGKIHKLLPLLPNEMADIRYKYAGVAKQYQSQTSQPLYHSQPIEKDDEEYEDDYYDDDIEYRPVSFWLCLGILLFPAIFAWFTLGKGYSLKARLISFAWFGLMLCLMMI